MAGGAIGLHLGKVDALILTFLIYRAVRATKLLAKVDRATLLSLLAYIMPTTLAYSLTMANIELHVSASASRSSLMIGLLAMFSWPLATRRATAKPTKGRGAGAPRLGPRLPRPPCHTAA